MSSSNRRKLKLNTVTVNLGCSSNCRRPKLSTIFNFNPPKNHYYKTTPTPKKHHNPKRTPYSTTTTTTATTSTTTFSPSSDSDVKSLRAVQGFGRIGSGGSLAVEKDSDDPYQDFRQSMLQMILEREIYSKEDLRELLNCFLQLNDPYYHGIIVGAFSEIWNGVYYGGGGTLGVSRRVRRSRDF
ncbi:hypothetical protein LguiA_024340 [Lonicera macranthoides]